MSQPSRRTFLAGAAAALAARPAFGQGAAADIDVIIVGAGAAGIAAARRLSAAGRSFTMVEAAGRIGGRCFTDTRSFSVPFDRGAHWILSPDINPLTKLAPRTGLDIYQAPSGQRVRIGERNAREGELEDYLSAIVRSNRSIAEAARGRADMDCLRALPKDLGDWQPTVEFTLGPYATGRDLREISAQDFSRSVERDIAAFCRQGYGALLAKLAEGIPVEMDSPITAVDTSKGARVEATTSRGIVSGRYMICTASIGVLASERIKFDRGLPKRQLDALAALKLGSLDHIALDLPGNPLGLQRDDLVFEKASGPRTAALLANVSGTSLSVIEVGGKFGRDLMAQGDMAAVDFAVQWLSGLFGNNVKGAVQRTLATRWNNEPWVQGATSTASPGGQWARAALREPIRERVYFAGEATHDTLWGTVGGAWESGERAADQVLRRLSGLPEPPPPRAEPEPAPPRAATAQVKPQPQAKPEPAPKSKAKPSAKGGGKSSGKSSGRTRRRRELD
ncbi:flavin monoamine oxidase family protein [Rhodoplanes sp. Z2-YC6860]|uniref:flavin monoamine oxidase family protein n=1 Tax=Rhodoplanes sp. Z2-YC6860 TaxID=674703 RepID=UPI00078CB52D|nr:NAD(P)/FAD-dependent oxidoreductase [Rhodoplanes sp. Z2-YC6860]AMN38774.1 monoamine oxidase [Rhodoplanes sp. Z2-YC6860]